MKDWTTYWYVCTSCDSSIEVTTKRTKNREPKCTCKHSHIVLCQTTTSLLKTGAN